MRSGPGFGGAAPSLLCFSAITLRPRLKHVDRAYLKKAMAIIMPFTLIGVFGLISLPTQWLIIFIYSITLFYSILWISGTSLHSNNIWLYRFLLATGGYVAGTSLTGAPLIVAVFMRNVAPDLLRNTLFVLWFLLVSIKMTAFVTVGIELNLMVALVLLPIAAIGHVAGLKAHEYILLNNALFKRISGVFLFLISVPGLYQLV